MKSSVTNAFRKKLDQLPASVQDQAAKAYALWHSDPYHNSLQFKRVSQRQPIYSVRVGVTYSTRHSVLAQRLEQELATNGVD
jgi:hypothetical protein